jgi:NMD protein affecting ribosome stability and mRNA decay
MGCHKVKCSNPQCGIQIKQCQTIGGMCPTCYHNKQQLIIQQHANNTVPANGQHINQ